MTFIIDRFPIDAMCLLVVYRAILLARDPSANVSGHPLVKVQCL